MRSTHWVIGNGKTVSFWNQCQFQGSLDFRRLNLPQSCISEIASFPPPSVLNSRDFPSWGLTPFTTKSAFIFILGDQHIRGQSQWKMFWIVAKGLLQIIFVAYVDLMQKLLRCICWGIVPLLLSFGIISLRGDCLVTSSQVIFLTGFLLTWFQMLILKFWANTFGLMLLFGVYGNWEIWKFLWMCSLVCKLLVVKFVI